MSGSGGKQATGDVAIVGAGVSGVYVGWRLLGAGAAKSVTIYEQSERIGGRLLSLQPPGLPGVWCELGGMRFTSNQELVVGLINELELATHPFPVEEDPNLNYLRGVHVRNQQFADPNVSLPYNLDWSERGMAPGDLLGYAIDQVIPGATKMSGKDLRPFLEHYKLDGRHVYDWGFWNLLARGLSHEGYELAGHDQPQLRPRGRRHVQRPIRRLSVATADARAPVQGAGRHDQARPASRRLRGRLWRQGRAAHKG